MAKWEKKQPDAALAKGPAASGRGVEIVERAEGRNLWFAHPENPLAVRNELRRLGSNQDSRIQSPVCYHCTTPHQVKTWGTL